MLWDHVGAYVLFPLGVLLDALWNALGHPIVTLYVLLGVFDSRYYGRCQGFRTDRYYRRLTRARMQSDLRSALVDEFYNLQDAIIPALCHVVSPWHRWHRGPLYTLFDAFAVEAVQATTGRKTKVWTQDRFAAFVASRLGGDDSGTPPILWCSFCYNALYPFTYVADNACHGRPAYSICGHRNWYQFASFAVILGSRNRPRNNPSSCSNNSNDSNDSNASTVLEQVAFVAANQFPIDMHTCGPLVPAILPHVRKLVNELECEPVFKDDFVHKPEIHATGSTSRLEENRGLGLLAGDIDWATHLAVAKAILAVAGIHEGEAAVVSYAQYETFWMMFRSSDDGHRVAWSLDHEMDLLWRSLFSVFPVDNMKDVNRDSSGRDETPKHPPPPLILQALDFLYPLLPNGHMREERRKNTLKYTSDADGLSSDGTLAALTEPHYPKSLVVYGHTAGDSPQPAVLAAITSSPLWCTYCSGRTGNFYVDDKHVLLEMAPHARVLQYSPTTSQSNKTTFASLVDVDDARNIISFGGHPGLILDLAAGMATLSSASDRGDPGHYADIPPGPHAKTPKTPRTMASLAAWTTTMRIAKLEVYETPVGIDDDLYVMRGGRCGHTDESVSCTSDDSADTLDEAR
ncbi:hypothetical protein SPI_08800 [Niveomyces insectorum RCEF 264]|uniref:Uncharacterized protein n=1 Tax=Niveomyces insectorum RCEF 264 TaxID=1081102 RepID=A0A167MMZ1_9HYPO|nr:hypothetical protein SPI_08800 [Niveomyces insectorum RCEF 264]